jgi:hypothetical protein
MYNSHKKIEPDSKSCLTKMTCVMDYTLMLIVPIRKYRLKSQNIGFSNLLYNDPGTMQNSLISALTIPTLGKFKNLQVRIAKCYELTHIQDISILTGEDIKSQTPNEFCVPVYCTLNMSASIIRCRQFGS